MFIQYSPICESILDYRNDFVFFFSFLSLYNWLRFLSFPSHYTYLIVETWQTFVIFILIQWRNIESAFGSNFHICYCYHMVMVSFDVYLFNWIIWMNYKFDDKIRFNWMHSIKHIYLSMHSNSLLLKKIETL